MVTFSLNQAIQKGSIGPTKITQVVSVEISVEWHLPGALCHRLCRAVQAVVISVIPCQSRELPSVSRDECVDIIRLMMQMGWLTPEIIAAVEGVVA